MDKVNVKSTNIGASAVISAGPSRIFSIYFASTAALGTIVIRDGGVSGTALATFDVPIGGTGAGEPIVYQIEMPGDGIWCKTSSYVTLTGGVDKVTVFYQ